MENKISFDKYVWLPYINREAQVREFSLIDKIDRSELSAVAFSGSYKDLIDKVPETGTDGKDVLPLKNFKPINRIGDKFTVDCDVSRYSIVTLGTGDNFLEIINLGDGEFGEVIVEQTGDASLIILDEGTVGDISLTKAEGTYCLLSYSRTGDRTYLNTTVIKNDEHVLAPDRIEDLQIDYVDNSTCSVKWTTPGIPGTGEMINGYEIKYSNSPIDPQNAREWLAIKGYDGPKPLAPGEVVSFNFFGLAPGTEYYFYIKSKRMYKGRIYSSMSSDAVYFRTLAREDTSKSYRINLFPGSITPQKGAYDTGYDDLPAREDYMIDEQDRNRYLETGYPDTKNSDYNTFWATNNHDRDSTPFSLIIDLEQEFRLDRLYTYSAGKPRFSVFGMKNSGYTWEKVGEILHKWKDWRYLDFSNGVYRFVKLCFDLFDVGSQSKTPVMEPGAEAFPKPSYNYTLEPIYNLMLYGSPLTEIPEGITSPLRRTAAPRRVKDYVNTNGHLYQGGRIHSMFGGRFARLYIPFDHFTRVNYVEDNITTIRDFPIRVNDVPWVRDNGPGYSVEDNLRETYAKYGVTPFLTHTNVISPCLYDGGGDNRQIDNYFLPGVWKPLPSRGVGGNDRYFAETCNAHNYKLFSKVIFNLAAKYGKNVVEGGRLDYYPSTEPKTSGLNLISGIECSNEPDKWWADFRGYTNPQEYAALVSAASDGHCDQMTDEDGRKTFGSRVGGLLAINPGTAGCNAGYQQMCQLQLRSTRLDSKIPFDVINGHIYCSNVGGQVWSPTPVQYGIPLENALRTVEGESLLKMINIRDKMSPDKEVWITEFGWGESGARGTISKFQCYSQRGKVVGGWVIPDRHRSDVKGAWTVRAISTFMSIGVNLVNVYSTECESNYFGQGQWDAGAGFEMFHWNDCKDETPGAKVAAVVPWEVQFARSQFATTGIFGQILGNGAYPITRAFWWIRCFRERFADYIYVGDKYVADSKVIIRCFKHVTENRGAYLVFYDDMVNTGVPNVRIPVPSGVFRVTRVETYVPEIPSPEFINQNSATDELRTGLPTARHDRIENGVPVVVNLPISADGEVGSITAAPIGKPESQWVEGEEIVTLPSKEENPYFPIVGPVNARYNDRVKSNVGAREYIIQNGVDPEGAPVWEKRRNTKLAWRQVEAVCDYIDHSDEGRKGSRGVETVVEAIGGSIAVNVSEFPEYYFFDAAPECDFRSEVERLSAVPVNSSSVNLYWNNGNHGDDAYELFVSRYIDSGYSLLETFSAGAENMRNVKGLMPGTVYYFKLRPKCGTGVGSLSGYAAVKTYEEVVVPGNLSLVKATTATLEFTWDYVEVQSPNFVYYGVYRSKQGGTYEQIALVDDFWNRGFTDTDLISGTSYSYKVRVLGINGNSDYSGGLDVRTLLPSESSPTLVDAVAHKILNNIYLSFNIGIASFLPSCKAMFSVAEDGKSVLIKAAYVNPDDNKQIVLVYGEDSISTYEKNRRLTVGYSPNTTGGLESSFGVGMDGFTGVVIKNNLGNFSNLIHEYKLNFCFPGKESGAEGWNDLAIEEPESNLRFGALKDKYGQDSTIAVTNVRYSSDGMKIKAYSASNFDSGMQPSRGDVPEAVYSSYWMQDYFANGMRNNYSKLVIEGLSTLNLYDVKLYSNFRRHNSNPAEFGTVMSVGTRESNTVVPCNNTEDYLLLDGLHCDRGGIIELCIYNNSKIPSGRNSPLNFMIINEYEGDDAPDTSEVFIREVILLNDELS